VQRSSPAVLKESESEGAGKGKRIGVLALNQTQGASTNVFWRGIGMEGKKAILADVVHFGRKKKAETAVLCGV